MPILDNEQTVLLKAAFEISEDFPNLSCQLLSYCLLILSPSQPPPTLHLVDSALFYHPEEGDAFRQEHFQNLLSSIPSKNKPVSSFPPLPSLKTFPTLYPQVFFSCRRMLSD